MYIDTHLHLICDEYMNVEEIVNNAKKNDVNILIVSGTNMNDNLDNLNLAKKFDNIYLAFGIHPEFCNDYDLIFFEKKLKENLSSIVAIGEIGLDYHYNKDSKSLQIKLFEKQLELAQKYSLPVVIHSRDATFDTINILKKYHVTGVIHCFSGSFETANEYIKMGFLLGIGGVVTFKNSGLKDVLKRISIDNIVLETDSPFLSPFRGKVNQPKNIPIIANFIANLYNVDVSVVANVTTYNAKTVFKLNK